MKIDEIREAVDGIPNMTFSQAKVITDVIMENQFQDILELGFRHGVSTCYMAGALDDIGGGSITTIDLVHARDNEPSIDQLLGKLGLARFVSVFYEPTSYTWRLMRMLEEDPSPRFDFCYIDGAHDWFVDGFAFFLVDKLLKPGGLIILDDLYWTFQSSPTLKDTEQVKHMPGDEKNIPQIRNVYELLVKPHPAYSDFIERDGWAYARKKHGESTENPDNVRTEIVYQRVHVGLGALIQRIVKRVLAGR